MRVAFNYQVFGFQQYGGVSRYAYELSAELAKTMGQDIAVIAPLYVNRYLANAPKYLKVIGMSVPRLPKTARIYESANSLLSWPALRCFRPDLVHETYYSARRIAPRASKVVLTVHDMIHEKFSDYFPAGDTTSKLKALSLGWADHVICISEQTRQDLIELLDINPAKTSVVHLGFTSTNLIRSGPKGETQTRPFLLYVGSRALYKNFERLLQAYAASPLLRNGFDLVCFGGGGFTAREYHLMLQFELPKECCVQVSGDDHRLADFYSSASAFIYPSLYEGFGIPPLEAMGFDCPVVCSNLGSIPEVVGDAAELFDPCDADSMQRAIERVVTDKVLQDSLVARGRKRIKNFSWERCARETLDVYERLLA
jgi:glycosyltransferase involved in cell wall biosynthesis